jgi:hypothetical protein
MSGSWNRSPQGIVLWRAAGVLAALTATGLLLASAPAVRSAGDERKPSAEAALPPDLQRVPGDAVGFLSLRLGEVWNKDAARGLREQLRKEAPDALDHWRQVVGLPPGDIERCTAVFPYLELGPGPYPLIFVETARPYDRALVLKNVAPGAQEEKRKGGALYAGSEGRAVHFISDRAYLTSGAGAVRELLDRPAERKEGPLAAALREAAGKHTLVAALNPEPVVRQFGDSIPQDARQGFQSLLKTRLVTLTVDLDDGLRGEARLDLPDETEAKRARTAMLTVVTLGRTAFGQVTKQVSKEAEEGAPRLDRFAGLLRQVEEGLKETRVRQEESRVVVRAHVKASLEDLGVAVDEAVLRVREAAERVQSANNLKQLALAMHSYAAAKESRFPPQAVYSPDGKPLLSWRVLVLPYLDQEALYKEFHLDEPWDGEHNKKLLARMPRVFAMSGQPAGATETYYQGLVGKSAFFDGKQGLRLPADFPDGTSNTIMLVEAAKAVPWTKAEDVPFDPDPTKPLPKLGGRFRGGFNAALCDGSVRFLRKTISDQTLRAAITRDGGEVLGPDF